MKIMINALIIDARENIVILELTEEDKENIKNMSPEATKIAFFPDDIEKKEIFDLFQKMK